MKKLFPLSLLSMMLVLSPGAMSDEKADMAKLQKDIADLQL